MNKIDQFLAEQNDRRRRKIEIDQRYREHNSELTDEEKAKLAELKEKFHSDDMAVNVVTRRYGGESVSVNIREYFRMVDQYMEANSTQVTDMMKLVNKADENIFSNAAELINVFSGLTKTQLESYAGKELSVEFLTNMSKHISDVCRADTGREIINSDFAVAYYEKETRNWTIEDFENHFGKEFVETFLYGYMTGDRPRQTNILTARRHLVDVIGLFIVHNDEIANLNAYIEYNERVVDVLERLAKCGEEIADVLKSPEGFADAAARSREETGYPKLHDYAKVYSDHFDIRADGSYDYFAIRYVMMRELAKAYEQAKPEYTVVADIEVVDTEIKESLKKADCYLDVAELKTFREIYAAYESAAKADKRTSAAGLKTQGKGYVEKIRKCKISLNFPGYKADLNNANQIMAEYYKYMDNVITTYNLAIAEAAKQGVTGLEPIECDHEIFAGVMLTVMARLLKKLTKNNFDKYDSLTVSSYFKRYAQIGMDLYSLSDIYAIIKPMIDYISSK